MLANSIAKISQPTQHLIGKTPSESELQAKLFSNGNKVQRTANNGDSKNRLIAQSLVK